LISLTGRNRLHNVKIIPFYEAKSKFSEILRDAAAGEIFVITHNGKRMAELRPCPTAASRRKRGMMRKAFGPVPADFNEPLADFAEYQRDSLLISQCRAEKLVAVTNDSRWSAPEYRIRVLR